MIPCSCFSVDVDLSHPLSRLRNPLAPAFANTFNIYTNWFDSGERMVWYFSGGPDWGPKHLFKQKNILATDIMISEKVISCADSENLRVCAKLKPLHNLI